MRAGLRQALAVLQWEGSCPDSAGDRVHHRRGDVEFVAIRQALPGLLGRLDEVEQRPDRRAQAVRDWFGAQGIDASEFDVSGKGELDPKYPNTRDERSKNRRVDVSFLTIEEKTETPPAANTAQAPAKSTPKTESTPNKQAILDELMKLEKEITEGAMMEDGDAAIAQLHALRNLGLKLAIDDFGTGHASLSYLRRFPLNRLKIDQSFVQRLGIHDGDGAIVHALIGLGHTLGMTVTAEGVETTRQEAALRAWGCDTVQGFLHGRPVPAASATQLLQRSTQLG